MSHHDLDILAGLAPADVDAIWELGRTHTIPTGGALFRLGDRADRLFVIARGRIALTLPMQLREHDEEVLIEERGAGQTVGWSALIPPHRFTLTATALIETDVLELPREALLDYFAAHPLVGYAVTRNVAAVVGQRLQVFQAMWLREMQRVVKLSYA
jgi:CRP-like cAMP-binding protein